MPIAAPNIQICPSHILTVIEAILAPNGGSARVLLDLPSLSVTPPINMPDVGRRFGVA